MCTGGGRGESVRHGLALACQLRTDGTEVTEPDTVYAKYLSASTLGPDRAKSALFFWGLALGPSPALAACTRGGTWVLKQLGDKSGAAPGEQSKYGGKCTKIPCRAQRSPKRIEHV